MSEVLLAPLSNKTLDSENTIVKHMVLKRKNELELRKGPLQKKTNKKHLSDTFLAGRGSKTESKMDTKI